MAKKNFDERYIPEPNSGCWLWLGELHGTGYGKIVSNGKALMAHRESYSLHNGRIDDGVFVLHKCDIPSCVNPDHLFTGTHLENMEDMRVKGRSVRGEKNRNARICADNVISIRSMRLHMSAADIAEKFNLSVKHVRKIINGDRWGHI